MKPEVINELIAKAAATGVPSRCRCEKEGRRIAPRMDCPYCGGTGFFEACPSCNGSGWSASKQAPCDPCGARGTFFRKPPKKEGFRI